jgi:hypothetical protein
MLYVFPMSPMHATCPVCRILFGLISLITPVQCYKAMDTKWYTPRYAFLTYLPPLPISL